MSGEHPFRPRVDLDSNVKARDRWHMERMVIFALAGDIAQRRGYPRSARLWHAGWDRQAAVDLVSYFAGSHAQADAYLKYLHPVASDFLALPHAWQAVETVADALMEARTLLGARLRTIVRNALRAQGDTGRHIATGAPGASLGASLPATIAPGDKNGTP